MKRHLLRFSASALAAGLAITTGGPIQAGSQGTIFKVVGDGTSAGASVGVTSLNNKQEANGVCDKANVPNPRQQCLGLDNSTGSYFDAVSTTAENTNLSSYCYYRTSTTGAWLVSSNTAANGPCGTGL